MTGWCLFNLKDMVLLIFSRHGHLVLLIFLLLVTYFSLTDLKFTGLSSLTWIKLCELEASVVSTETFAKPRIF